MADIELILNFPWKCRILTSVYFTLSAIVSEILKNNFIMPLPILKQADEVIKQKIIDAADNIRKKYLSLKLERSETDEALNKFLTPIRTPWAKIAENTSNIINTEKIKNEFKEEKEDNNGNKKPLILPQTSSHQSCTRIWCRQT